MFANAARNLGHHKMVWCTAKIDTFTILANMPYFAFDTPKQFIANNTVPSHTVISSLIYVFIKNGGSTGSRGCLQVIIGRIEQFLNDFLIKEASRAKCDWLSWVELVEGIRGVSV